MQADGEVNVTIEESEELLRLQEQERQGIVKFSGTYCVCNNCCLASSNAAEQL